MSNQTSKPLGDERTFSLATGVVARGQVRDNAEKNKRAIYNGIPRVLVVTPCKSAIRKVLSDAELYSRRLSVLAVPDILTAIETYSEGISTGYPPDCLVLDVSKDEGVNMGDLRFIASYIRKVKPPRESRGPALICVGSGICPATKREIIETGPDAILDGANWPDEVAGLVMAITHR